MPKRIEYLMEHGYSDCAVRKQFVRRCQKTDCVSCKYLSMGSNDISDCYFCYLYEEDTEENLQLEFKAMMNIGREIER